MNIYKKVLYIVPDNYRKKLKKIFFINFFSVFLEILSIGLIIPFLLLVTDQKKDFENLKIFEYINFQNSSSLIIFSLIFLLSVFTLKNVYLFFALKYNSKFTYNIIRDLSNFIFLKYLNKNYQFFSTLNSSILIRNVINDVTNFGVSILLSGINLIVEILVVLGLSIVLIIYNPQIYFLITIPAIIFLITTYLIMKPKLKYFGDMSHNYTARKLRNTRQGFEGIKEIIINQAQQKFFNIFKLDNQILTTSEIKRWLYLNIPKYLVEVFMVFSFVLIVFFMLLYDFSNNEIVATLGLFAATAFRLMPSFLRITSSLNLLKFYNPVLNNLYKEINDLNKEKMLIKKNKEIKFDGSIVLSNINFKYPNSTKPIFEDINFKFLRGDKIGIFGESGSGKSTFIDIFTGLIKPNGGDILKDNINIYDDLTNWQSLLGYVPQKPYIIDSTIKNNITFKLDNSSVDDEKLSKILSIVELEEHIGTLKDGINEEIGENGTKMSGGQLQRIALARALYKSPKILILDESTNALDNITENKVLENLNSSNLFDILIIISHKASSLKFCNKIFELKNKNFIERKYE